MQDRSTEIYKATVGSVYNTIVNYIQQNCNSMYSRDANFMYSKTLNSMYNSSLNILYNRTVSSLCSWIVYLMNCGTFNRMYLLQECDLSVPKDFELCVRQNREVKYSRTVISVYSTTICITGLKTLFTAAL
jgi:hypothetical protein